MLLNLLASGIPPLQAEIQVSLSDLKQHSYLEISSEEQLQFAAQSEGWSGSGSEDDPYIIEDYHFAGSMKDPSLAYDIKNEQSYSSLGFHVFSLVISNIQSFITIRNNQFDYSVLINIDFQQSNKQVKIEKNEWVNPDNPNNLIIYGSGVHISLNRFYGSDTTCQGNLKDFFPRVFIKGDNFIVEKNIFSTDLGCHPLQQLYLTIPSGQRLQYADSLIHDNYFQPSDLAVFMGTFNLHIYRNDFEAGDFVLFSNAQHFLFINENNFYISEIGQVGKQTYTNTTSFIQPYYDVQDNRNLAFYQSEMDHNYYSNHNSPDVDYNGIVDNPYYHTYNVTDYNPATTPFSTFYHPVRDLKDSILNTYTNISVIFISILGLVYFNIAPWILRKRKLYKNKIAENIKEIESRLISDPYMYPNP